MIKFIYLYFLVNNIIYTKNNQVFIPQGFLYVFKNYLIKYSIQDIVEKKDISPEIKNVLLTIYLLKGFIDIKIINILQKYKDLIIKNIPNTLNPEDEKQIKNINTYLINNVNYKGYEDFIKTYNKYIKDNYYLQYNICILDKNHQPSLEEINVSSMEDLIQKYCIFRFISNSKCILFFCPECNKKEIKTYLLNMSIKEKKLIYLKSQNRYVIIERLEDEPIKDNLTEENLKYLYIKYTFSLIYPNYDLFIKEIYKFLHKFLCN